MPWGFFSKFQVATGPGRSHPRSLVPQPSVTRVRTASFPGRMRQLTHRVLSAILGNFRADTEGEKTHTTESWGVFNTMGRS